MKSINFFVFRFFLFIALSFPSITHALGPPASIYGTISINGTILTQDNDTGYSVVVTRADGTHYTPVTLDDDGLSETYYMISVPLDSPDGATTNDTALLHVYRKGTELSIISPVNGEFTVGEMGSLTQVDIQATATLKAHRQSSMGGEAGTKEQRIQMGGGDALSKDMKIRY